MTRVLKILTVVPMLFCLTQVLGQVKLSGIVNYPPAAYAETVLDTSNQNIYYRYTRAIHPDETDKTQNSLTVLQIGDRFSSFTDSSTLKLDSIQKHYSQMDQIESSEITQQINVSRKIAFKKVAILDHLAASFYIQGKVHSTNYEYKENRPNLKWDLIAENKMILDYKVHKARVHYGGRTWLAWYAPQIPIPLGPYVFGGLPGVIMELYDQGNNFHFLAVGLDRGQSPIYKRSEKNISAISKKDFFKAERNFHERPELFVQGTYRGVEKLDGIPYNPMELVDE